MASTRPKNPWKDKKEVRKLFVWFCISWVWIFLVMNLFNYACSAFNDSMYERAQQRSIRETDERRNRGNHDPYY